MIDYDYRLILELLLEWVIPNYNKVIYAAKK